jgi:hypothetical protein
LGLCGASAHRSPQRGAQEDGLVAALEILVGGRSEHGASVDPDDLSDRWVEVGIQDRLAALDERVERMMALTEIPQSRSPKFPS